MDFRPGTAKVQIEALWARSRRRNVSRLGFPVRVMKRPRLLPYYSELVEAGFGVPFFSGELVAVGIAICNDHLCVVGSVVEFVQDSACTIPIPKLLELTHITESILNTHEHDQLT